jgi:uncharacterized protein (TIGR03382 family)
MKLSAGRRLGGIGLSFLVFLVVSGLWGNLVNPGYGYCHDQVVQDLQPGDNQDFDALWGSAAGMCTAGGVFSWGFFLAVAAVIAFWIVWRRRHGKPSGE